MLACESSNVILLIASFYLYGVPELVGGAQNKTQQWISEQPPVESTLGAPKGLHAAVQRRYYDMKYRRPRRLKWYRTTKKDLSGKKNPFISDEDENYYEPYMPGGHWAYSRGIPNLYYNYTVPWRYIGKGPQTETLKPERLSDNAYSYCPLVLKLYGKVCGRRITVYKEEKDLGPKWRYEYRQFNDLCDMQYHNYLDPHKQWYPIHTNQYCVYKDFADWHFQVTNGDLHYASLSSLLYYAESVSPLTVPQPKPYKYG